MNVFAPNGPSVNIVLIHFKVICYAENSKPFRNNLIDTKLAWSRLSCWRAYLIHSQLFNSNYQIKQKSKKWNEYQNYHPS